MTVDDQDTDTLVGSDMPFKDPDRRKETQADYSRRRRERDRLVPPDFSRLRHGIRSTYNRGCRCDPCRQANSDSERQRRRELVARVKAGEATPSRHGTRGYNLYNCRCEVCVAAARDARGKAQRETAAKAVRRGQRYTEAELAIALNRTFSVRQAAEMLGRSFVSVRDVRKRAAAAGITPPVLAVPVEEVVTVQLPLPTEPEPTNPEPTKPEPVEEPAALTEEAVRAQAAAQLRERVQQLHDAFPWPAPMSYIAGKARLQTAVAQRVLANPGKAGWEDLTKLITALKGDPDDLLPLWMQINQRTVEVKRKTPTKAASPRPYVPKMRCPDEVAERLRYLHARVGGRVPMTDEDNALAEEYAALLAKWNDAGVPYQQLGAIIGVSGATVQTRLGRYGYRQLPPSMRSTVRVRRRPTE